MDLPSFPLQSSTTRVFFVIYYLSTSQCNTTTNQQQMCIRDSNIPLNKFEIQKDKKIVYDAAIKNGSESKQSNPDRTYLRKCVYE